MEDVEIFWALCDFSKQNFVSFWKEVAKVWSVSSDVTWSSFDSVKFLTNLKNTNEIKVFPPPRSYLALSDFLSKSLQIIRGLALGFYDVCS